MYCLKVTHFVDMCNEKRILFKQLPMLVMKVVLRQTFWTTKKVVKRFHYDYSFTLVLEVVHLLTIVFTIVVLIIPDVLANFLSQAEE